MSLLTLNDKGVKRLAESWRVFKEGLIDKFVYDTLLTIVTKAKKNAKQETKVTLDEVEGHIKKCRENLDEKEVEAYNKEMAASRRPDKEIDCGTDKKKAIRGRKKKKSTPKKNATAAIMSKFESRRRVCRVL
jgi:hypothetical protein